VAATEPVVVECSCFSNEHSCTEISGCGEKYLNCVNNDNESW